MGDDDFDCDPADLEMRENEDAKAPNGEAGVNFTHCPHGVTCFDMDCENCDLNK